VSNIIRVANLVKIFRVSNRQPGWFGLVRNLISAEYREVRAVDGINFNLERGELVGYLGPNGAGKSTTLKILTGLLVPTSGEVQVDGYIPWKNRSAYVSRVGAVFGQRTTLWWDLPVIDSFDLLQPMYRIPPQRFRQNLKEFTEILELGPFLNTPVRSLSLGQRMRADLVAALMHDPPLLFLDEPTIGLDVVAKERIRQFIQYIHQKQSTTIILTTHDLSDVEKLCERVIILDLGKVLYDGSLSQLTARFEGNRTMVVTFAEDYRDINLPGVPLPQRQGERVVYTFDPRQISSSELVEQLLGRYRVADLELHRPEIGETIRRIYEEKLLHLK